MARGEREHLLEKHTRVRCSWGMSNRRHACLHAYMTANAFESRIHDYRPKRGHGGERAGDRGLERATTVPRPRPPMAPRKPSFPKPILPRPIVKPAGGAKCCAWMRAHPYQKRCFRRRGPRHITERRHAATPSSLNRWLAHSIPPAFISGRICFCSCLSSYRVGWHGRGTEAASEASAAVIGFRSCLHQQCTRARKATHSKRPEAAPLRKVVRRRQTPA